MSRANILICDDNPSVILSLTGYLEAEDMTVFRTGTGEDALQVVNESPIDLAILDIMLPGMSGIEVCREIKVGRNIPVIMLSAKGEEIDRIIGLEMGADDYVTKPFSAREVVIRATKLLARYSPGKNAEDNRECIKVGNLRIFPDSYEVLAGDQALNITPREFKLLCYMADNAGRIRSRDQIISEIWGAGFDGETRVVDILVNRLRGKLAQMTNPKSGVIISTAFGIGYRLDQENESQSS